MKIQIVILAIILSLFSTVSCRKDTDITITEETTISGVNGFITNEENFAVGQAEVIINGASFITNKATRLWRLKFYRCILMIFPLRI